MGILSGLSDAVDKMKSVVDNIKAFGEGIQSLATLDKKIEDAKKYIDGKMAEAQAFVAAESRALTRRLLWIALGALLLQTAAIVGALLMFR